jgi:DNA-binding NarL/FixJ family response regulator
VRLSDREREVLELLAQGNSHDDIAAILMISPGTVRTHTSSIVIRLQVENRIRAAVRSVDDRRA